MYLLLVEDDSETTELTIRELKRYHLANGLVHVKDGRQALDFLFSKGKFAGSEENRNLPMIILLDIQTPGVGCLEVLREIKEDQRTSGTPVILLTPSALHPDIHKCYKLGAAGYIVTPLNFERFSQAILSLGFFWLLLNQAPQPEPTLNRHTGL